MGVTLRYRGSIALDRIPAMVRDLKNIAATYGWGYAVLDDGEILESCEPHAPPEEQEKDTAPTASKTCTIEEAIPLSGVMLTPEDGCETVSFLFDADGKMSDLVLWLMVRDGHVEPEAAWVSVKTQFARIDTHIVLVELLRYLQQNYLTTLEVVDEGQYWESGDAGKLRSLRERVSGWISKLTKSFSRYEPLPDDALHGPDSVCDMVERMVEEMWEREREDVDRETDSSRDAS